MKTGYRVEIDSRDSVMKRFGNQLGALGEGKARAAMARAVNHTGAKTYTAVRRALAQQTSAPVAIIRKEVQLRKAAHKGTGAIEAVIRGRGSELPLGVFKPKQFSYGVRVKVWGKVQQYKSMFGAPGRNPKLVARLGGQPHIRVGKERFPIQRAYGPSLPKEMVKDATREAFLTVSKDVLEKRLEHEIGRMLKI